jgi:hypothetical protein
MEIKPNKWFLDCPVVFFRTKEGSPAFSVACPDILLFPDD